MEYRTEAHTFMASANLNPMPRLGLNANAGYSIGRGNITDLHFDSMYPTGDVKLDLDTSAINPNQPYLYDVAYLNDMDSYSDLDFTELNVTIGAAYRLNDFVGLGLNYFYTDFKDNAPYVYGEQDATIQSVMASMSYTF